jgi:NADH dehydrogenase FAD-containing subunit
MKRSVVTGLFALAHRAVSALPLHVSNTDVLDTYDYVVVGGGTGGMTLASRLSEDASSMSCSTVFKGHRTDLIIGTVLLIEAGPL